MSSPISWDVAEKVAIRIARQVQGSSYSVEVVQREFDEVIVKAAELVEQATGLISDGPPRALVVDRSAWVVSNIASFKRLLSPLLDKLGSKITSSSFLSPVGKVVTGAQLGAILGFMSTKVLGQYDLLVIEEENPQNQDLIYFVGPNILEIESRFDFPSQQFRLWIAIHEATHRAQFTAIPWMNAHFKSLLDQAISTMEPDPKRFLEALKRVAQDIMARKNPLAESGLIGLFVTSEQKVALSQLQGLMSLLEGHGDIIMNKAGTDLVPQASYFAQVLNERRNSNGIVKFFYQLIGLEAKMKQYAEGERFIETIESIGGDDLINILWKDPQWLPSIEEIRNPQSWIERVLPGKID